MDKELNVNDLENVIGGVTIPGLDKAAYDSVASLENAPFFEKMVDQLGFLKSRGYDIPGAVRVIASFIRENMNGIVNDSIVKSFVDKYW